MFIRFRVQMLTQKKHQLKASFLSLNPFQSYLSRDFLCQLASTKIIPYQVQNRILTRIQIV